MPLFDITINILVLFAIIGLAIAIGFAWRSRQLIKKNKRIAELEMEMLDVHAEILDVQKEYCNLETRMKELAIPVISMKKAAKNG